MGFCGNPASQQIQNQSFESVNKKRSSASVYDISDVVNNRLKQLSAENGGKNIYLTQTLLALGPLGLKFSNTDSFLDLVEKNISHAKNTKNVSGTNRNPVHASVQAKGVIDAEKFKASNFSALSLTIGSWKEVANREGALVAKFYYAKKKLVWEIMKECLKSKIEIRWTDIVGIRASIVENDAGILEVELGTQPTFFQESDPEPKKHTLWKRSQDFTNGQALINRRHYLEFPPRVLEKYYEKLLQADSRLLELSQTSFPNIPCPYFPFVSYNGSREFFLDSNGNGSNQFRRPVQSHNQIHQPCLSTGINSTVFLDSNGNGSNIAGPRPSWQPVQAHNQIHQPCLSIKDPTDNIVMDFSLPQVVSNQLGVNNLGPGMATNIWNQSLSTSFGETQVMGYQIQHSLSTDMGYQIQQPGFTDTQITQVMGYQIEPPFSTNTQVMGYQIDQPPATSFQNNVSAPCDDREGAGRAISEPQAYNNNEILMNPLMMYEELQCINNQNNYMQCDDGAGPGLQ